MTSGIHLYSLLVLILPWEVAGEVAVVTGDFPRLWADWLVVDTEVLVAAELTGGFWPAPPLVMVASRPSGFVPYCTGWNNLVREKQMNTFNTMFFKQRDVKATATAYWHHTNMLWALHTRTQLQGSTAPFPHSSSTTWLNSPFLFPLAIIPKVPH